MIRIILNNLLAELVREIHTDGLIDFIIIWIIGLIMAIRRDLRRR